MDTSGLETLERVQQRYHVNGWSFKIERCSPAVDRILQLVGLDHDLVDQHTAEEVIGSLDDVQIVDALATAWGVKSRPDGRTVWFEIQR